MRHPISALVKRYPVLAFYVLAFAISWLGMIPQAAYSRGRFPFDSLIFTLLAGAGPALAAIIALLILRGKTGPDELVAALSRWRASFAWYFVTVLGGLAIAAVTLALAVAFGAGGPELAVLTIEAFIYTWLYNSTGGSLVFVTLYHASADVFVQLPSAAGVDPTRNILFRLAIVVLVAVVLLVAYGPARLSRRGKVEAPRPATAA